MANSICFLLQEDMQDFADNSRRSFAASPAGATAEGTQYSSASDSEGSPTRVSASANSLAATATAAASGELIQEVKSKLDGRIEKLSYQLEESVKRQIVATERQHTASVERHEDISQTLRELMMTVGEMKKELAEMKTHSGSNSERKGKLPANSSRRVNKAAAVKTHLASMKSSSAAATTIAESIETETASTYHNRLGVTEHLNGPPVAMVLNPTMAPREPEE
jgi:chromosome segregation ATPase